MDLQLADTLFSLIYRPRSIREGCGQWTWRVREKDRVLDLLGWVGRNFL